MAVIELSFSTTLACGGQRLAKRCDVKSQQLERLVPQAGLGSAGGGVEQLGKLYLVKLPVDVDRVGGGSFPAGFVIDEDLVGSERFRFQRTAVEGYDFLMMPPGLMLSSSGAYLI